MDERPPETEVGARDPAPGPTIPSEPSNQPSRSRLDPTAEAVAIAQARIGRRDEALRVLMTAYGDHIIAFALRVVGNIDIARDVSQHVFLTAFQKIGEFEGRSSLWCWLCSITTHRCLDELRRRQRLALREDFDVWEALEVPLDPATDADRVAKRRALEACLAKLPVSIRTQLLMRFFWGLTYGEIGEMLEEPEGTVQVRISRILPRLRRCLRNEGVER